ncbi:hypothetical protein GTH44_34680 [Bradyrhizobium japonicum]|jgi:hypothetical protein|nr:hypothetical protein [Bradyrhizobium japonicum]BAL12970.1 hypothetical protein BJ6T_77250 [Bradyrhizobium japonicum USDA 6]
MDYRTSDPGTAGRYRLLLQIAVQRQGVFFDDANVAAEKHLLENHFHNQLRARLLGCEAITQLVRRPPLPRANTSTARASFPARCRMTHRRVESHDWCLLQSGREAVVSCRHPGWRLLHRPRLQAYKQPGRSEGGVLWRADVPSYRRRHRTPRLRRPPPSMARTSAGVLRTLPFYRRFAARNGQLLGDLLSLRCQ